VAPITKQIAVTLNMIVPLVDLQAQYKTIKPEIDLAVKEVIESQRFILGETVSDFESNVAQYCEARHAIGVSSGTDALLISLMAAGIGPGDEVITTPFTFFATAGVISRVGATPVFVDIDSSTYNIDPNCVQAAINSSTKAIIPVDIFGQPCELDIIMEIAQAHGIVVIEDAAQAIGATYKRKPIGSLADFTCFSFFPTKNLGGYGDGGMVLTESDESAERLRILRAQGSSPKYFHPYIGGNFRLDALQAVILDAKLPFIDDWNRMRGVNAAEYKRLLATLEYDGFVNTPESRPYASHVFNQYSIQTQFRDKVRKHLKENGVATEVYYPLPLHLQDCFKHLGYTIGDLPKAESVCETILSLPVFPELNEHQQQYVVNMIEEYFGS